MYKLRKFSIKRHCHNCFNIYNNNVDNNVDGCNYTLYRL